jgi:hypothetical protein
LWLAACWRASRAQSPDFEAPSIGILPPSDILASVRYVGLDPTGEVVRRGAYYVLHAIDATGVELRVVVDAQFGDVLFMAPALNAALTPLFTCEQRASSRFLTAAANRGSGRSSAINESAPE